tara:strand:+ start:62 stop:313 length:252 start_codon:yes stop_codon:yes gene_type:complete
MAKGTITISGEAEAQALVGATTATGTFTVGVDGTGHDVKFFGATAGKYWLWDESADEVQVVGRIRELKGSAFQSKISHSLALG